MSFIVNQTRRGTEGEGAFGVPIEAGLVKRGTRICVPSKELIFGKIRDFSDSNSVGNDLVGAEKQRGGPAGEAGQKSVHQDRKYDRRGAETLRAAFHARGPSRRQAQIPSDSNPTSASKKYVNPFDPEATVPLPLELEDQFGPYSSSVWKRNERERCRVRNVNDGYERLRKHLPVHVDEKRISKVDTLRLAIRYIRHLDNLLKNHLHQYSCKCFAGFQEESEGNIAIDINQFTYTLQ
ncbi:unnamed protein product [Caenorhabditis sp. 36 PRJEB53466]|nr:unnamed protein product [Caenorhabditis sp. 36 PRJEB53466]